MLEPDRETAVAAGTLETAAAVAAVAAFGKTQASVDTEHDKNLVLRIDDDGAEEQRQCCETRLRRPLVDASLVRLN